MPKLRLQSGAWPILEVFIRDTSQSDGRGLTGLTHATAGLTCAYHRNTDAAAVVVPLVEGTVGDGDTEGGFVELLAANMPGVYQFVVPAAALFEGASSVVCLLHGAADMAPVVLEIQIVPVVPPEPPPNDIIVWIDGVDRTSLVSALRWSSTINGIGTASFTVKDPDGLYIPEDDQVVEIEVAGTIRWAGTIANPAGTSHLVHRAEGTFCQVTCQDHNQRLQRALSNTIIPPQSLRDTLEYLCDGTLVPMGITLDPTQDEGPTLTTITSPWLTTEQFVDYLATQTGWVRRVDQDSQLKMWAVGSVASGVTLSAANANVRAAAYDLQRFDYRSAQWVVFGPNGVLHVADAWTGDGVTQVFTQHYQNFPTRPATVTVGATTYPVGIYGVDAFEWTWNEVYPPTLVHTGTAVGVGIAITADYDALFPTWVYVEGDEFGARPWTRVDFAPHILHWDEATAYAESLIRQHQPRLKMPKVTTYLETIAVGSTVVVDFPVLGIDALTCFVRATETVVIPTGAEVLLETTLDLLGGTDDVPANSATDLWKRIIFGEQASSGSSGAVGSTSGGLSPATSANAHTLLSTTHSDVVAATVVRGDVLVANSTPAWARVARGAAGTMLRSDGTDVAWSTDGSGLTGITAAAHNLLSASHGDALAASVARGDLLIGNSTPKWARLAVGATNRVLASDGTDPAWTAAPTLTSATLTGGLTVGGALQCAAVTNDTGLASGTYTPTLTGVTNVSSLTAYACLYQRIGTIVMVSGTLTVDPTTGATLASLGVSLPLASAFSASTQCAGVASSKTSPETGVIDADATNDRAHLEIPIAEAASHLVMFTFTYQVI